MSMSWPEDPSEATKPAVRPVRTKVAVGLMIVGSVIGTWLALIFFQVYQIYSSPASEHITEIAKSPTIAEDMTSDDIREQMLETAPSVLVICIIFAVSVLLWIVMAFMVYRGMSWTRWAATVLAGLNLLFVVTSPALADLRTIASVAIGLGVAALLWTRPARVWSGG